MARITIAKEDHGKTGALKRAIERSRPSHRLQMHWAVTVERNGEKVVTIESNCLSGREISAEDAETIRTAARHLLSFIGDPTGSAGDC